MWSQHEELSQAKLISNDGHIRWQQFQMKRAIPWSSFALPVVQVLSHSQPNLASETNTPTWPFFFWCFERFLKQLPQRNKRFEAATSVHWSHVEVCNALKCNLKHKWKRQTSSKTCAFHAHLSLKHFQHMPLSHLGCRPSDVWKGPAFLPHSKMFGVL